MSDNCPYCEKRYTDYFYPKYYSKGNNKWGDEREIEIAVCTRCDNVRIRHAETLEFEK